MGKARRNKELSKHLARHNPVGIPSNQTLELVEDDVAPAGQHSSYLNTILEQLQSHMVEERDSGLNSLSLACQNPRLLESILSASIVKTAGPLLLDASAIVRHSAAGALRNMSLMGPGICDLMVSQDIMTPLTLLFKRKYVEVEWVSQFSKASGTNRVKIDSVTETFVQAVNLLWNLCETNQNALQIFKNANLIELFCKCLNSDVFGTKVGIAVAQFLNMITEDNKDIIPDLDEFEVLLQRILARNVESDAGDSSMDMDSAYLQMLATGILLNLYGGQLSKLSSKNATLVINKVSSALDINHIQEVNRFSSDIPINVHNSQSAMETNQTNGATTGHNGQDMDLAKIEQLEAHSENVVNLLSSQILTLELLSNAIFVDDDDDDTELDDESVDSPVEDFDECVQEDASMEVENEDVSSFSGVFEGVKNQELVTKIVSKTRSLPVNVVDILLESVDYGKHILSKMTQLRCTAMLCFQNMVVGLSIKDLGGVSKLKLIWTDMASTLVLQQKLVHEKPHEPELEATTSALRALVQRGVDENCSNFIDTFTTEELSILCNIYSNASAEKIHANLIKIIGGIGVLLTRKKIVVANAEQLLLSIGEFLLNCISHPSERGNLWRVAEALDTVFDVFAEDDFNHVMQQLGLIEKLKVFLPQFKRHIRNQRRDLGENRAIIETARTNLSRFIDYKVKQGCS